MDQHFLTNQNGSALDDCTLLNVACALRCIYSSAFEACVNQKCARVKRGVSYSYDMRIKDEWVGTKMTFLWFDAF